MAGIIQHKNSISSPLLSLFFQPSLPRSQCEGHERMLSGVGLRCWCQGHCPAPAHAPRQGPWGQGRFSAGGKINASCSYSPGTQAGSGAQQEQEPAKQKYWPTFFFSSWWKACEFLWQLVFSVRQAYWLTSGGAAQRKKIVFFLCQDKRLLFCSPLLSSEFVCSAFEAGMAL